MPDIDKQDVLSSLVNDLLKEKRSERRWRTLRSLLWLLLIAYIAIAAFTYINSDSSGISTPNSNNYVSLIRWDGMIAPGRDFSAESVTPDLRKAFADKTAKGVVIVIDSPGGTPVQAAIIHDTIIAFKKKYHKKVIVVGEDMLTSGAYFVAVAADKIYVNPNTIAGSVGVIVKGFGFVDAMQKLGITRRVYTAGTNKDRMDPFLPQNPDDQKKIQQVMGEVHQNFVQAVMEGRKGKLHGDPAELFSGDFWSGLTAVKLGLVDDLGNLTEASEKEFGTSQYKEYGGESNLMRMISEQLGSSVDRLFSTF